MPGATRWAMPKERHHPEPSSGDPSCLDVLRPEEILLVHQRADDVHRRTQPALSRLPHHASLTNGRVSRRSDFFGVAGVRHSGVDAPLDDASLAAVARHRPTVVRLIRPAPSPAPVKLGQAPSSRRREPSRRPLCRNAARLRIGQKRATQVAGIRERRICARSQDPDWLRFGIVGAKTSRRARAGDGAEAGSRGIPARARASRA